jgi:hypothetical protein
VRFPNYPRLPYRRLARRRRALCVARPDRRRDHHLHAGGNLAHRFGTRAGRLGQPFYGVLLAVFVIVLPKGFQAASPKR